MSWHIREQVARRNLTLLSYSSNGGTKAGEFTANLETKAGGNSLYVNRMKLDQCSVEGHVLSVSVDITRPTATSSILAGVLRESGRYAGTPTACAARSWLRDVGRQIARNLVEIAYHS